MTVVTNLRQACFYSFLLFTHSIILCVYLNNLRVTEIIGLWLDCNLKIESLRILWVVKDSKVSSADPICVVFNFSLNAECRAGNRFCCLFVTEN